MRIADQFDAVADAISDYAVYLLDREGCIVSWNTGARRMNGYDTSDVLGRHFSIFFAPDDLEAGVPARVLADATANGRAIDEGWRVRKDGSRYWASSAVNPRVDAAGRLHGFVRITRDETDRARSERDRRQLDIHRNYERLARQFNDEVINRVFAAGLKLQAVRRLVKEPMAQRHLDDAVAELDEVINHLRSILFEEPVVDVTDHEHRETNTTPMNVLAHSLLSAIGAARIAVDMALDPTVPSTEIHNLLEINAQRLDSLTDLVRAVALGFPDDAVASRRPISDPG